MFDFLQLMYQEGLLSSTEMGALQKICLELKERPVRVLRSLNIVSQLEIQGLLQEFYGVGICTQELIDNLSPEHADFIPSDLAISCSCVGIAADKNQVTVLLEDPSDTSQLQKLEFFLEKRVNFVVATAIQLTTALEKVYNVKSEDQNLTTVLEASRGVVGGRAYDPSQLTAFARHDDLLVDQTEKFETLRGLLASGLGERLAKATSAIQIVQDSQSFQEQHRAELLGEKIKNLVQPRDVFELDNDDVDDVGVSEEWTKETSQSLAKKILSESPEVADVLVKEAFEPDLDEDLDLKDLGTLDDDGLSDDLVHFESSEMPPEIQALTESRALSDAEPQENWKPPQSLLMMIPKFLVELSKLNDRQQMLCYLNERTELSGCVFSLEESNQICLFDKEADIYIKVSKTQELRNNLHPLRTLFRLIWRASEMQLAG